jgi:hypothetical protein
MYASQRIHEIQANPRTGLCDSYCCRTLAMNHFTVETSFKGIFLCPELLTNFCPVAFLQFFPAQDLCGFCRPF